MMYQNYSGKEVEEERKIVFLLHKLIIGIVGLVGEAIKDVIRSKKEVCQKIDLNVLNNYVQFLINETEDAIAIIPIRFKGLVFWKTAGTKIYIESGKVIPKSVIKSISVIKFSPMTPTIRWITIELIDGYAIPLMAVTNVKTVPYHIENFKKFYEKYKK